MFVRALFLHWKAGGLLLLPFAIGAFGLPLLALTGASTDGLRTVLNAQNPWLPFYPFLALGLGFSTALTGWQWDHHGNHVYANSLPRPRWAMVLAKFGAGGILIAIPSVFLLIGAFLASASVDLPEGLRTYPTLLATRFFFASLLSFSMMFALAAKSMRSVVIFLIALVSLVVLGEGIVFLINGLSPGTVSQSFLEWGADLLLTAPGPLRVFLGSWTLVDV